MLGLQSASAAARPAKRKATRPDVKKEDTRMFAVVGLSWIGSCGVV